MKRILCTILAVLLSVSVFSGISVLGAEPAQTSSITFTDVDKTTAAGQAIYKLVQAGVIVGYGDDTFRPNASITRAELCKIVNMIFNYTDKADTGFSDMTKDDWYYENVLIAKKAGYIKGHDDGTFKGDDNVTREEACTILTRVATLYDLGITMEITDEVSEWAVPYVQMVVTNYLMPLEAGNTFRAKQNITRSEFCEVFAKFVKVPEQKPEDDKKEDDKKPSGNTGSRPTGGNSNSGNSSKPSNPSDDDNNQDNPPSPGEDDNPDNFEEQNKEVVANLEAVLADVNKVTFITQKERDIIALVKSSIEDAIRQKAEVLIDADFVRATYADEIAQAKKIYNEDMNEQDRADFRETLLELQTSTVNWLMEYFDFNL